MYGGQLILFRYAYFQLGEYLYLIIMNTNNNNNNLKKFIPKINYIPKLLNY